MLRWMGGWLLASVAAYAIGSALMTQVVLLSLARFDVSVDIASRLSMTAFDIRALTTSYLPLIAIALLIAFATATAISRWRPSWMQALFLLAGATSVGAMLGIMTLSFGMNPLAGARGFTGVGLQMLAGLAGAVVFIQVQPRNQA